MARKGETRLWRTLSSVFVLAVAVNYPWEMLQAPLYRMDTGSMPTWLHCFRASLGDGVLLLAILILGAWILGRLDWFHRPGLTGYAWMLTSGLCMAAAVEWMAVHVLNRWSYRPAMPLLPRLDIGLVPVAQMLVLPPAIFAVAAWLVLKRRGPAS